MNHIVRPTTSIGILRGYLRLMRLYFVVNFKSALEYRGNFLFQIIGMALNNAAFLVFWNILLQRTGSLEGYGFREVLFLWGMGSAAFGVGHVLFGNVRSIGRIIVNGELDVYLLQPRNPFISVLVSRSELSAWGDILFGVIIFAVLSRGNPAAMAQLILFAVSGAVIIVSALSIAESLSFFWGNTSAAAQSFMELLVTAVLYPESIFGPGIRWVFYSILPAGFISFIPLRIFTVLRWELLPAVLAIAALYATVAFGVFALGLRRYESGNLMQTRL